MNPLWQARYEVARGIGLIPAGADAPWSIPEMLKVIDQEISPYCRDLYFRWAAHKMAEIIERHSAAHGEGEKK